MNKQKGSIGFFEFGMIALICAAVLFIVYAIATKPTVKNRTTEYQTIDIVVMDIDPPKHFHFDYLIPATGEIVKDSRKHCSGYSDSKNIKIGNGYTVKIRIDTLTYDDGNVERVLITTGCDLMDQIPKVM